ncbi:hypothetical protein [Deinococcus peraridilitoris]|uniref:Uncharacterized protein n=1 Tax=Deinococcus peraridilitoris (strain DSM 19664 / LMG 22246 / CIP 109416 / KR-200) TaxID=937777 RepID=L0A866_DEIPD|nr:hypothetical protein [Deinococcus peraridilitoris]AFZ69599.1 hypothetical protein Deipe_4242 [Deinococcus peraridilitoris DSM 19664]
MVVPSIELPEHLLQNFQPAYEHASTAIWWRFDDTAYPEPNFFDNPGVLLPWWSTQLALLAQGAKTVELQFMEGPYALTLRALDCDLIEVSAPPDLPAPIVVTLPALVRSVQDALSRVAPAFESHPKVQHLAQGLRDTVEELDRQLLYRERRARSRDE